MHREDREFNQQLKAKLTQIEIQVSQLDGKPVLQELDLTNCADQVK